MRMEPDAKPKGSPADLAFMAAMEGMGVKFVDVTPDGSKPVPMEPCKHRSITDDGPYGDWCNDCQTSLDIDFAPAPVQPPEGEPMYAWVGEVLHDIDPVGPIEYALTENQLGAVLSAARQRFATEAIEAVEATGDKRYQKHPYWNLAIDAAVSAIRNKK
jgi:hypothetical protein